MSPTRPILVGLLSMALVAACSSSGSSPSTRPASEAPAASGSSATPAASDPSAWSAELKSLVEAAQAEGEVVIADLRDQVLIDELGRRFNDFWGTSITVTTVPLRGSEAVTRVTQEAEAGQITLDVIDGPSSNVIGLVTRGVDVLDDFDYVATFGDTLPGLTDVAERTPDVLQGKALEHRHLVRAILYNTELVAESDVPTKWDDLLDPKWAGKKIGVDTGAGGTYQHVVRWSDEQVLDFSVKLAEQDPIWISGSPNVAAAVGRGEAILGIAGIDEAKNLLDLGLPVGVAKSEFYPGSQQVNAPVKGSPRLNAARLWTAWSSTVGLSPEVQSALESVPGYSVHERAWPGTDSWIANTLAELGGDVLILQDAEDFERAGAVRQQIVEAYERMGAEGG